MSEQFRMTATEAAERYHKDMRFRAIAQSVVHEAMQDYIARNPEADYREADRLAMDVAVILMERLFKEDAELNAQRHIADQYRKIAEDTVSAFRRPPFIPIVAPLPRNHPETTQTGVNKSGQSGE